MAKYYSFVFIQTILLFSLCECVRGVFMYVCRNDHVHMYMCRAQKVTFNQFFLGIEAGSLAEAQARQSLLV